MTTGKPTLGLQAQRSCRRVAQASQLITSLCRISPLGRTSKPLLLHWNGSGATSPAERLANQYHLFLKEERGLDCATIYNYSRHVDRLGRMATELMALVQDGKIRPTLAEQIALEAIAKALERLAKGHVRGKIVARVQS
jgi:Zinc-binding dehydrogenase